MAEAYGGRVSVPAFRAVWSFNTFRVFWQCTPQTMTQPITDPAMKLIGIPAVSRTCTSHRPCQALSEVQKHPGDWFGALMRKTQKQLQVTRAIYGRRKIRYYGIEGWFLHHSHSRK